MFGEFVSEKAEENLGFIFDFEIISNKSSNSILALCNFNIEKYNERLFNIHGIRKPLAFNEFGLSRKCDYLAGRLMAKEALIFFDSSKYNVRIGKNREPIWPSGYVGSITHSKSKAMAIVSSDITKNIGIDLEKVLDFHTTEEIHGQVHSQQEYKIVLDGAGYSSNIITSLIFSAKESLFKATYSKVGYVFEFLEAEVVWFSSEKGLLIFKFNSSFRKKYQLNEFYHCHFEVSDGFIYTKVEWC